ncbi:hypothetical protein [Francisella philomiragia]|uniref:hypothetical protein n=1 Tax=Francisella philomiragia TaxID=28110 RepID=UPI001902D833|nr:hypothetical protein [Francisella philomiragia]MBK2268301.1 hypothetical protein [Francisella philomiragia]MBK2279704.1 hypothetical protein [Francisella philomiragia]MBK2287612.1 hypothetical protein [Francisella philomiragia]MBK2289591.1 hypothetical protein [Francisella philomiragia]MBK2291489.1 hypothetical protein [Francisella philomiragia]
MEFIFLLIGLAISIVLIVGQLNLAEAFAKANNTPKINSAYFWLQILPIPIVSFIVMIVAFVKLDEQNNIFKEKYNVKKIIFNINNLWWYVGLGIAAIVVVIFAMSAGSEMSYSAAIIFAFAFIAIVICMFIAFISMIVNIFTAAGKINLISGTIELSSDINTTYATVDLPTNKNFFISRFSILLVMFLSSVGMMCFNSFSFLYLVRSQGLSYSSAEHILGICGSILPIGYLLGAILIAYLLRTKYVVMISIIGLIIGLGILLCGMTIGMGLINLSSGMLTIGLLYLYNQTLKNEPGLRTLSYNLIYAIIMTLANFIGALLSPLSNTFGISFMMGISIVIFLISLVLFIVCVIFFNYEANQKTTTIKTIIGGLLLFIGVILLFIIQTSIALTCTITILMLAGVCIGLLCKLIITKASTKQILIYISIILFVFIFTLKNNMQITLINYNYNYFMEKFGLSTATVSSILSMSYLLSVILLVFWLFHYGLFQNLKVYYYFL